MNIGTVDNPVVGDIWEQPGWHVIPVNSQGVHGRGLAKQACDMGLIRRGKNRCFAESNFGGLVISIAVKGASPETAKIPGAAWSEKVTAGNLRLLERELASLREWISYADVYKREPKTVWIPFLGLGFGEGDPREILPLLRMLEDAGGYGHTRFIKPDAATVGRYRGSFRPGVRKDQGVR